MKRKRERHKEKFLEARLTEALARVTKIAIELERARGNSTADVLVGGLVVKRELGDRMRDLAAQQGISISKQMSTHLQLGMAVTEAAIDKAHEAGCADPQEKAVDEMATQMVLHNWPDAKLPRLGHA